MKKKIKKKKKKKKEEIKKTNNKISKSISSLSHRERYDLLNLLNSISNQTFNENQQKYKEENIQLENIKNYENLNQNEYINEIIKIVSFIREDEDEFEQQPRYADDLKDDYVFTYDNFIKMIMINMRMSARVPLIIMGETGCGKTSLIRALASLKRADMIIFNIHAGIDNNKIIEFVNENNLLEDENTFKKEYKKKNDIWVFLDEVNTSNSLGLFSEMMVKKSILGKPIKKNVSFIAACNPYKKTDESAKERRKKEKSRPVGLKPGAILDKKNIKQLAYTVNPLPFSLLNFVFSFEHLEDENEKKYIVNMLEKSLSYQLNFDKEIQKLDTEQLNKKINNLKEQITKSIVEAQNYVREIKGVSSVSLRDVNRFVHLFEWFLKKKREDFLSLNTKKEEEEKKEEKEEEEEKEKYERKKEDKE